MASDLTTNYRAVFDNKMGFGTKPALILVDFVQAYFDPKCELYAEVENELASALRIRDAARASVGDVLIIYTNVIYSLSSVNGGLFTKKALPLKHFIAGSEMGNWASGITPRDDELVISKQYPSAFFGTSLSSTLSAAGIDSLMITGLTTSGCVRATCVDCISHGFIPIVVADACGDRHEDPHNANLFDMNAKYADVVSETSAIEYLNGLSESRC